MRGAERRPGGIVKNGNVILSADAHDFVVEEEVRNPEQFLLLREHPPEFLLIWPLCYTGCALNFTGRPFLMAVLDNVGLPMLRAPGRPLEILNLLRYVSAKILLVCSQVDGCRG